MTRTTTATREKATEKPVTARKPRRGPIHPVTTERPVATTTVASVRIPRLRFALNAPKIEVFFEKAKAKGVTVTLVTDAGTLTDLVPLKVNPKTYSVQNGHVFTVAKAAVKRIEYMA